MEHAPIPFSPTAAIAAGWKQLSSTPGAALGLLAFALLAYGLVGCASLVFAAIPGGGAIAWPVSLLLAPALGAGMLQFARRTVRGDPPQPGWLLEGFSRWWPVTGAYLLIALGGIMLLSPVLIGATVIGLTAAIRSSADAGMGMVLAQVGLLFVLALPVIVIGAWLGLRLAFFYLTPLDDTTLGPLGALRRSWEITRGRWWRLAGLHALGSLVMMAGLLVFFIGVFVAIPMVVFAWAHAYEQLAHPAGASAAPAQVPPAPAPAPSA